MSTSDKIHCFVRNLPHIKRIYSSTAVRFLFDSILVRLTQENNVLYHDVLYHDVLYHVSILNKSVLQSGTADSFKKIVLYMEINTMMSDKFNAYQNAGMLQQPSPNNYML